LVTELITNNDSCVYPVFAFARHLHLDRSLALYLVEESRQFYKPDSETISLN